MGIIENISKIKNGVLKNHNLKKSFNNLLFEIESIKGSMQLSNIFELIGTELQKNKINSIICVINEKRNEIKVRNINFPGEFEKVFTTENIKQIDFKKLNKYQEVVSKKEAIFCQDRIAQLKKVFLNYIPLLDTVEESNSIIAPLLLKGELIGTVEIFSPQLEKDDLEVVGDFVKRLITNLTNNILFYEIKESEKRYRNLFQNSSEGLIFFNLREKRFKESNRAMKEISGYSPDELKQLHYLKLFLREDRERIGKMIETIKYYRGGDSWPIKMCTKIKTKSEQIKICDIEIGLQMDSEEIYFSFSDVTQQKNIATALKHSEEKYRRLVDYADDGVIMFELDGKISFLNKAMTNILEGSKKEILEKNFLDFVNKDDLNQVKNRIKDRVSGKSFFLNIDFRINTLKGREKYINFSGTLIERRGKKTGIQAIIRDVSKSRELQEMIYSTKRHYVNIIDSIKDDIVVISDDYKIVSFNSAFANSVGMRVQEIKGKDCDLVMPRYKSGAFSSHCFSGKCKEGCVFFEVFSKGKTSYFVEKGKIKNEDRYFGIGVFPIKNYEKTFQAVITIRDVSEAKRAEEENLRLTEFNTKILDSSPVSIMVLDKEGRIILTNGMAKRLTGDKENKLLGKKLTETGEIKNIKELIEKYDLLLNNGVAFHYDNLSYVSNLNGQTNYLNIIAVPLYDKEKNVDGAISMAIDNTEKVLAKQKLVDMNKELEMKVQRRTMQLDNINKELKKVLELKSKFISDASHELRTPLTVIQGNLDLARQEHKNKRLDLPEEYVLIGKEVEQMTSILADLTMLTNADASTETINYDNVDVNLLSTAVVQTLKVLAKQKNIDLHFVNDEENIEIIGDETKLEKLLLNLVRNAIKYTEEGGLVEVRTQKNTDRVKLIVTDNGIGIPENDLPYIFERFYRVDKARSRNEGGTGLGLSICKWIAEAHGGKINVTSKLGSGTTFVVELPFDCRKY